MSLRGIVELLQNYPPAKRLSELCADSDVEHADVLAPVSAHPLIGSLIRDSSSAPLLFVTTSGQGAEDAAKMFADYLPDAAIATFPSWETLPHERLAPSADTIGRRTRILRRIAHPDSEDGLMGPLDVVVASVRAVIQPIEASVPDAVPARVRVGEQSELTVLVEQLVNLGYERVDLVERRGQLAVRGGIVDVFPAHEEHAVRVEFWGDEVDSIRYFAVADQRSLEDVPEGLLATAVHEPVAQQASVMLTDLMPTGTQVLVSEPERVRSRAADVIRTAEEFLQAGWQSAAFGGEAPVDVVPAAYWEIDALREAAVHHSLRWWHLNPLPTIDADVDFGARLTEDYRGDAHAAFTDIKTWIENGGSTVVTARGSGPLDRFAEELADTSIGARQLPALNDRPETGVVTLVRSSAEQGFVLDGAGLMLVTESDLFGGRARSADAGRMPSRRRRTVDPLTLKSGDFVVHEQHGVGKYVEMIRRTVQGAEREYLIIEYAPSKRGQPPDRLFLPDGSTRPHHSIRGWRVTESAPTRRWGLGEDQRSGAQSCSTDRR